MTKINYMNNWNADKDYGKEYAIVHFHIATPSYPWSRKKNGSRLRRAFDAEMADIFASIGWNVASEGKGPYAMTVEKDKQNIYCHPKDMSGVVLKNEIAAIAQALAGAEQFQLETVEVRDTVHDWSNEEYAALLDGTLDKTRREIDKNAVLPDWDKFNQKRDIIRRVSDSIAPGRRLKSVRFGTVDKDEMAEDFVANVLEDLLEKGYLAIAGSEKYVRALSSEELLGRTLAYGALI